MIAPMSCPEVTNDLFLPLHHVRYCQIVLVKVSVPEDPSCASRPER